MNDHGYASAPHIRRKRFAAAAAAIPAVLGVLLSMAGVPRAARAADTYVDTLLGEKSTRRSGFAMYVVHPTTLGGTALSHSLVTEVGGAGESQTLSILTLRLNGRFTQFQATVGREPATDDGSAGAYFEVWGDGDCLFRSAALYPARGGRRRDKNHPEDTQPINVAVRGVRTLQLVTRYAAEAAPSDSRRGAAPRASGCLWGDARLTSAEPSLPAAPLHTATASPTVSMTANAVTPALPAPDARRDAVRMAALLLAAGIASNDGASSAEAEAPPSHLPVRIALLPLRPCARSSGSRRHRGGTWTEPADAAIQSILRSALPAARRGSSLIFDLLGEKETEAAARALPGPIAAGTSPPAPSDLSPVLEECRKNGVATIALATLLPSPAGVGTESQVLELKLFDVRSGRLLTASTRSLPRTTAAPSQHP